MNFQPLGDRILVKPEPPEGRQGLIFFPDQAKKPKGIGRVVAMGPGMRCKDGTRWPMPNLAVGDRIVFDARHPFPRTRLDGEEFLILRDDTVLGVLEE